MSEMALNLFYKEVAAATRQDLIKQKMLLPMATQDELCSSYCRTPRSVTEALLAPATSRNAKKTAKILSVLQKTFPGEGVTIHDFKPLEAAQSLENEVAVIAVNTEKHFFDGAASLLTGVTHLVKNPVVRWDFIIDEYQIGQAKLWGADAVRIVTALLDQAELNNICNAARQQGLEVIAEVHNQSELERVLALKDLLNCIYFINDEFVPELINNFLQQIPADIPVLVNCSSVPPEELCNICCDGVVADQSQYYLPARLKKLKKDLLTD